MYGIPAKRLKLELYFHPNVDIIIYEKEVSLWLK